ncbi:extracellular solute-binding protein [Arthrobacter sp. LAPM80]|uniref:extracellular solute-binding protein n=1 Tax=Arthrobacter sp. LAPM80 TaxID=3141788 RepID=UPI00398AFD03
MPNVAHTNSHLPSRRTILRAGTLAAGFGALATLAACGTGTNSAVGGAGGASKTLSLQLLGADEKTIEFLKTTVAEQFKAKTGFGLELRTSDWASGFQKMVTAAASGSLADVVTLGGIWTAPLASKKALLPLDEKFAAWDENAAFNPNMLTDARYEDKLYAVPYAADIRTACYRMDHLEKVGYTEDSLPTTWDEYKAMAIKLSAKNGGPAKSPLSWFNDKSIGIQQSFAQLMFQAGGSYWDASGKASFSSDAGKNALDYLVSFYTDGLSDFNDVFTGTGAGAVAAGRSSAEYSGLLVYRNTKDFAQKPTPKIVAGPPLKATAAGKPVSSAWVNKFGVAAGTKHQDEAWELVKILTSATTMETLNERVGALPTRSDAVNSEFFKSLPEGFSKAGDYVRTQPTSPNMLAIGPAIKIVLQKAVLGQATTDEALAEIDKKVNEINGVA